MLSRRRFRDKYDSWKKLFLQNWTLFKASRIGVVGLAIMIAFLLIAFTVPFIGLRDPLYWLAPESDTISVREFWGKLVTPSSTLYGSNASVDHTIGFRIKPEAGDARADRIYIAEGRYLFAVSTLDSQDAWTDVRFGCEYPYAFKADDTITVDPIVINYGDSRDPMVANITLMFGTQNGTVYVMQDNVGNARCPVPLTRNLGSPITGMAAFNGDQYFGVTSRDRFVVGTQDGRLFGFTVNGTAGGFYRELWNDTINPSGAPTPPAIHLAGAMIKAGDSVPQFAPCFYRSGVGDDTQNGRSFVLGTSDGYVVSLWTSNGTLQWENPLSQTTWSSSPVLRIGAELPGTPPLVYAATDESKVFVLNADTGKPLPSWVAAAGDISGGLRIVYPRVIGQPDTGVLYTPAVFGANIFITSSSGWLYNINRDPILGASNRITLDSGEVAWAFHDETIRQNATLKTYFRSGPHIFDNNNYVVAGGGYNNGTTNPTDDLGIVYVLDTASGRLTWKRTFPYAILSTPVAWRDPGGAQQHTYPAVWFGTRRGDFYSYSIAGAYLAPLPPSWAHTCPPGSPSDCVPGRYPSGNFYILGTDARGRDIFSQLLWGSRIALLVGFASAFFTIAIGVIVGLVAGYLGGRVESILMRFTDVILVIPGLPLVIILAAVLGAGVGNIILVIAIVGWPGVARVIRAEVLSLKERPFIDSARVTGASNVRIMFRHIAPNVAPLAFLYMTFAVSGAILTEAALSFIGLGDVNTISWGIMLQDVSQSKALTAWWWLLPPGLAITLISLAFFLVGRAFDEIVNPRLRKR